MDVLTALNPEANYSMVELQMIIGAWVMTHLVNKTPVSTTNGHVEESDYKKQSIYSLFYSLYRSVGEVDSGAGDRYECTFNTWGYDWPANWGPKPTTHPEDDPQRFGKNAYTGLYHNDTIRDFVAQHNGQVHVVEMGCGTGAGAHHVCKHVLPECTYEAFDMQEAGVQTCRRKFVPELDGRLKATRADCTKMPLDDGVAHIVAVCETHVTEMADVATEEDNLFFREAVRIMKPGGYLVWGNVIPNSTWKPCFELLESLGMKPIEIKDVTPEAITARDEDRVRVDAYVRQAIEKFPAFKIPVIGAPKALEAELAMKNFYRNPGTNLYQEMVIGTDSYKVVLWQKSI